MKLLLFSVLSALALGAASCAFDSVTAVYDPVTGEWVYVVKVVPEVEASK